MEESKSLNNYKSKKNRPIMGDTIHLKPTPDWGKKDDDVFLKYHKSLKDK